MSVRVSAAVWSLSEQKGTPLIVMLALADMARDDGVAWPGVPHIATKARISKRQAVRVVTALRESGELELVKQGGGSKANMYRINLALLYSREALKVEEGDFEDMGDTPDMLSPLTSRVEGVTDPLVNVTPDVTRNVEPSEETSSKPIGDDGVATSGGDGTLALPGLAAPPSPPSPRKTSAPVTTPEVQEVWDYFVRTFPDRVRVKELTPPRVRIITKALTAVGGDVALMKSAIDGLKSYRDKQGDPSKPINLDVIFATGPHSRSNLTEQVEWWASHAKSGGNDVPSSVPSAHRGRVLELAVQVLTRERRPGDASVSARAEEAEMILMERFKLKVKSDGAGKLAGWEASE